MKKYAIAAIGELLWDVLPNAEVLGGAPVNFAYHVTALGAEGIPISTVGNDLRGARAMAELRRLGVETAGISVAEGLPTGYVDIALDIEGVATYSFPAEVAWDCLQVNGFARDLQDRLDAVCFGTLAQRSAESRRTIRDFLDGLRPGTVRIYDVNLRQNFYSREIVESSLNCADILKLSDEELPVLAKLLGLGKEKKRLWLKLLLERFGLSLAILTRGSRGSLLLTPAGSSDHPGIILADAADTIGAGDAFTAAVTIGYLGKMALGHINDLANRLAAYVCTRQGAMPDIPETLKMTNGRIAE
ncbi:MAG TPA: carbohydrate kinase [Desulfobulbaceae bacterium]|nr:carbohydrate kinase [Desulfobulbaceae bacterium]